MEHSDNCKKCGHLMADHGKDYWWKPYCANGNDGDCDCDIPGDSYDEAISKL